MSQKQTDPSINYSVTLESSSSDEESESPQKQNFLNLDSISRANSSDTLIDDPNYFTTFHESTDDDISYMPSPRNEDNFKDEDSIPFVIGRYHSRSFSDSLSLANLILDNYVDSKLNSVEEFIINDSSVQSQIIRRKENIDKSLSNVSYSLSPTKMSKYESKPLINNKKDITPFSYSHRIKRKNSFDNITKLQSLKFLYNSNNSLSVSNRFLTELNEEDGEERQMTWNEAFQNALEMPQDNDELKLKRAEYIATISQDFVQTAIMYGKIIISEVFLPDENKTIKPTKMVGGNAGGEKFIFNGILYKFAVDWKDIYTDDMFAMKAASHELKGLELFFELLPNYPIHVPLMVIIDYLGFRLIAVSLLPISTETLVYGSCDSGMTVKAVEPYSSMMKEVASQLSLRDHVAGIKEESVSVIPFPTDIEGHKGEDGRFYIIDFARVMPPTQPLENGPPNQYLYNLFRPEFIKKMKIPLNPDSFSNFDKHDPNRMSYRDDIKEATNMLISYIPEKIASMEIACEFTDKTTLSQFIELIHKEGINVRYLGIVRKHASSYLGILAMIEMISRGIKNHLRKVLREAKRQKKVMALQPYRQTILNELNIILGNTPEYKDKSILFWKKLHHDLKNQFIDFPTSEELMNEITSENIGLCLINNGCPSTLGIEDTMDSLITYECFSCGLVYPQGICQVCAQECHSDHSLSKPQFRTKTFCSCDQGCKKKKFRPSIFKSEFEHALKTMTEALGYHRVMERAANLAGIQLSKDALNGLKLKPNKFVFVLPDIKKLKIKSKQIAISTLSEAISLHLHGIANLKDHHRTRIFHQCNNLFEKTIRSCPGSLSIRKQFLEILYEQIMVCDIIDEKILKEFVEFCNDQKDINKAKNIIIWIHKQGEKSIRKVQDELQGCFSILLSHGRDLKVKERLEILEFIADYGYYILSLDLSLNEYSTIIDDNILTRFSEKCKKLHYLNLKYLPRKVSNETLMKLPINCKHLKHVDLSSCSVNDDIIASFTKHCPKIRSLDINSCHNLTNESLKHISNLSELTVLNISYNENLSDIIHLSKCKKLELLTMKQCQLIRSQFSKIMITLGPNLKILDCSNCKIDNPNVLQDILTFCPKLKHLYLDGWENGREKQLLGLPKSLVFLSINGWKIREQTLKTLKKLVKLSYNGSDIMK